MCHATVRCPDPAPAADPVPPRPRSHTRSDRAGVRPLGRPLWDRPNPKPDRTRNRARTAGLPHPHCRPAAAEPYPRQKESLLRALVYYVAATLDGFIAGPGGEFDFLPVPEDITADTLEVLPETVPTHVRAALGLPDRPNQRFDTALMGRGTYEPALREGVTSPYAHLRQIVFSRTLAGEDPAVQIIGDRPPAEVVRELKQQDGADIWLVGGGKLAAALLDEIDELIVKRSPRVACAGIPLFDGEFTPTAFVPVATKEFASGITRTTYVRER